MACCQAADDELVDCMTGIELYMCAFCLDTTLTQISV